MKKQPTPPTPAELLQQVNELNAVFPRQLCELTINECEAAFRLATGKGKPVARLTKTYLPDQDCLEVRTYGPKVHLSLYTNGIVECIHWVQNQDYPVPINAPALTDYLRSVGVNYPAK